MFVDPPSLRILHTELRNENRSTRRIVRGHLGGTRNRLTERNRFGFRIIGGSLRVTCGRLYSVIRCGGTIANPRGITRRRIYGYSRRNRRGRNDYYNNNHRRGRSRNYYNKNRRRRSRNYNSRYNYRGGWKNNVDRVMLNVSNSVTTCGTTRLYHLLVGHKRGIDIIVARGTAHFVAPLAVRALSGHPITLSRFISVNR